jgi:hypothetical protein
MADQEVLRMRKAVGLSSRKGRIRTGGSRFEDNEDVSTFGMVGSVL